MDGKLRGIFFLLLILLLPSVQAALPPFQPLVDAAAPNSTLTPPPGTYAGPVVVNKPLIIDGQNKVTIDGGGKGTLVVLKTDGATLQNLHLTNSGQSHNDIDAGVHVRGKYNVVKGNTIDNCLFGVDLQQSEGNIVRGNRISSKPFPLGERGDAVRLWYSFRNKVTDNILSDTRDMVAWYSRDNEFKRNQGYNSRYSLHFMYSYYNLVEDNHYYNNAVGIFVMYSEGVVLRNNIIAHAAGPTGVGVGFKEASNLTIEGNQVLYCASGLYVDVSPFQPDTTNRFKDNLLAYNGIAVRFLNDWTGNEFRHNQFAGNLIPVVVSGRGTANRNQWEGNYWSDYQGFDRNRDSVGDTPHEIYAYADQLWQDQPYAQFFKGSPVLESLDFLEKLAPFSKPVLLVQDKTPLMHTFAELSPPTPAPANPATTPTTPEGQTQPVQKDALQLLLDAQGRQE